MVMGLSVQAQISEKSGYRVDSSDLCDGFERVSVSTPANLCVGILASKNDGLKMPRYAVQSKEGIIYVTEMGGWAFNRGTVYALYQAKDDKGIQKTVLVNLFPTKKLTMPNGILIDPEGRLYVGTPTGILRFSPRNLQNGKFNIDSPTEIILNQFAQSIFRKDEYLSASSYNTMEAKYKNKHPLVQLAANKDFTELYFNVGAASDDCSSGLKTKNSKGECIQSESDLSGAAVWKAQLSNDRERKVLKAGVFARGLRNSMALAVHEDSGLVIQGENNIDLPLLDKPYEEINLLKEGQHYGWPYCHSRGEVSPFFRNQITAEMCSKKFTVPYVFMPAHTAPLGLLYYRGERLKYLKNQLLVSWHGYQKYGHRIVAYPVDSRGLPTSESYQEIVFNWQASQGVRPRGAPTGLLELNDESILIIDDKNSAILRLSSGDNSSKNSAGESSTNKNIFSLESINTFQPIVSFFSKNCAMCHSPFQKSDTREILNELHSEGMINVKNPFESSLWLKLKERKMPPEEVKSALRFKKEELDQALPQLELFLESLAP